MDLQRWLFPIFNGRCKFDMEIKLCLAESMDKYRNAGFKQPKLHFVEQGMAVAAEICPDVD